MDFRALVVSADAQTVGVLRQILEERSLEVEDCADAKLAEARLIGQSYAVVLVDCEDQGEAIELMSMARSAGEKKTVLIVAVVDAENETRELFARGANFLLYKPVSAERATESLQAAWSLLPSDRRGKKREHVGSPAAITYATTADASAPLLNLSEDGAAIHSPEKMPPPCRVYFQFTLPGDPAIVRLSGDVVWQDARGHVGVHFTHVPQTSRRVLDAWLTRNRVRYADMNEPQPLILELASAAAADSHSSTAVSTVASNAASGAVAKAERRGQSRRACRLGVNVYGPTGGVLQHCTLTDISGGGCYVETTQPLAVGTSVIIEVRTHDFKLNVRGKVQSKHPGYGMGIAFKAKTDEDHEQVRRLLAYQENPSGQVAEAVELI